MLDSILEKIELREDTLSYQAFDKKILEDQYKVKRCPDCSKIKHIKYFNRKKQSCKLCTWEDKYRRRILASARIRAEKSGLEFNLIIDDIVIPKVCPVLGINLRRAKDSLDDFSPSLDRVDNSKGYTRDNIAIISMRANRIKNSATTSELYKIIEYMEKHKNSNATT